jgi:hypothetical protein
MILKKYPTNLVGYFLIFRLYPTYSLPSFRTYLPLSLGRRINRTTRSSQPGSYGQSD